MNGLLIEKTCNYFCWETCNEFTQVFVFVCTRCFKNLQQATATIYDLNFGWNKHYLDKTDIRQVYLNSLHRFCTLSELKSNYAFYLRHLQIISMTTYYKFVDCEASWRNYFKLHEHLPVNDILSHLCNKTLAEIFRLIFFLSDEEYHKEFDFYHLIQREIQVVASNRKFGFFLLWILLK